MGDGNQNKIEKEVGLDAERWRSIVPPFLRKTYLLVEDPKTDDIISWNAQGTGFVVWRPVEFARDLLPTIFKHSNFSSFVRQLNTYGFRKTVPRRWEFCNDKFRKDKRELLSKIKRRRTRNTHKTPSSTAATVEHNRGLNLNSSMLDEDRSFSTSLSDYDSLCEENVRLREDNKILYQELQSMKNKCKGLLDLVSTCVNRDDEKERPKLFGVRLEVASGERMKNRSRGVAEEILKYKKFLNLSVPMKVQMHA